MKMRFVLLFLSVLIILFTVDTKTFAINGTPHIIYGKVFNADGTTPEKNSLETYAYILNRPNEILEKTSVGCGYELDSLFDGWLWFESGNFVSPWAVDETIRIIAVDTILQETGVVDLILDSSGNQRISDIYLAYGDHVGPIASNALVDGLNPASIPEGTASVNLTASLNDTISGNSNIQGTEYFINEDPGYGSGTVMEASDGIFDSPQEEAKALVNTSSWTEGSTHTIYVRGYDIHGNWGTQNSVVVEVTKAILPPSVTLDPVTSPTNLNSQVLTGTMDEGAIVSVTCPTATVGTVTYPTATTWTVMLTNMQEGSNSVTATASYSNMNVFSSVTAIIVVDTTPPTGTIAINNNAQYTGTAAVTLTLSASDVGGSSVAKVCVSNTASCTAWEDYVETKVWILTPGDGSKTVYAWYQDNLGNTSTMPCSASIILDTTAPVLTVSTLSDGSWTNNELLNISGQVTDNTGIQQFTINDIAMAINPDGSFSYPVVLQDGPNTVGIRATDLAGNEASDMRTINLDQDAPVITIATPADNMKTKQSWINVTGTVDDQSTVTVRLNASDPAPAVMNGNNFIMTVTLIYGINTIEVTATDLAGNTSTVKRTITFDDLNPSLSVTNPAQDVKTNQADMIIRGDAGDDLTVATVTITLDGNIYTPLVTGGHFEQPVTYTEEKIYQIYVEASDEAGNETTVQRNVVYDITASTLTLDPVTSPTNLNSQVLTGTMEEGATVSVTCPTATVGTVTYPAATEWTATLSNMQEGNNLITIIATDQAGNTSLPISATIVFSAGNSVINTSPAKLWIGLKNSDDQGTQFDLRTELYINGVRITEGETLCITGVTRNPSNAKEVTVAFNPISNGAYTSGDILSLKVLTRIGTTPDGQKCSGPGGSHNNAVGLRLYYDAPDRPSRFGAEIVPDPMKDLFLHSSGSNYFLDNVPPAGAVKYKDSSSVNYSGGNPWKEIGTWTKVLQ